MRTYRPVSLNPLLFLIALNIIIFIVTLARPGDIYSLLGLTVANFPHQPWTIITNLFVHDYRGIWHILFNMISLFFLGRFLLQLVGEERFLVVYFLGGIVGNLFFILLILFAPHIPLISHLVSPQDKYIPGVGASGAIFAIGGALAVMAPGLKVFIIPIPIPVPLWVAIIIFLLISFVPGIAWQAHLGGLLLGLGAGYYFKKRGYFYF